MPKMTKPKITIEGRGRLRIEVDENDRCIEYTVWSGHVRRTWYCIDKYRLGWKKVWDETLVALVDTINELEEGTGIQSRAFQQSSSTESIMH